MAHRPTFHPIMAIIDLTTAARVKALLSIDSDDTSPDAVLALLVTQVSARIERYIDRPVEVAARTEYHDVRYDTLGYQLAAWPVTSVASIKNSTTFAWASATAKVDGTDYTLDLSTGILRQITAWQAGPSALQVVYTAGIAANTAAVPPDLADACEKQCAEEWMRRGAMMRTSSSARGASESTSAVQLLPVVQEILRPWRRIAL
jgi:uncharacterized phiE125 gp8 family phage protein